MKPGFIVIMNGLSALYLTLITGCVDVRSPEAVKKDSRKTEVGKILRDTVNFNRLIDLYNKQISRYALESVEDFNSLNYFDDYLKENPEGRFSDIQQAIQKERTYNRTLCVEINSLKKNISLFDNNDEIENYLTVNVFRDSVNFNSLYNFFQKRNNERDAEHLQSYLKDLRFEIDSFCNKNKIFKTSGMGSSNLTAVVLLLVVFVPLMVYVILRLKKKSIFKEQMRDFKLLKEDEKSKTESKEEVGSISDEEFYNRESKKEATKPEDKIEELQREKTELTRENNRLKQIIKRLENTIPEEEESGFQEVKPVQHNTEAPSLFYFPPPNNDVFPITAGSAEKRTYDAFKVRVKNDRAYFKLLVEDAAVLKRAIESSEKYILPVCEIDAKSVPFGKASKIEIVSEGVLTKEGDSWKLNEKSVIKLI